MLLKHTHTLSLSLCTEVKNRQIAGRKINKFCSSRKVKMKIEYEKQSENGSEDVTFADPLVMRTASGGLVWQVGVE